MDQKIHKTSPRDFFLHLLSIVTLYGSAASFLVLVFQYINTMLPDAADAYFYTEGAYGAIRWAIAMLIVVFPTYLFTTRFLKKGYAREPEKRDLRVRKWLTYFTLFISALVILGNIVALIFHFLDGEITLRFILKVISLLFVAGSIFGYYFMELKSEAESRKFSENIRYGVGAISLVVFIFIVLGIMTIGSPIEGRMRKLDMQRINDLQTIQAQVVNYWINTKTLPENLEAIENTAGGFILPKDPETGEVYAYAKEDDLTFELCATFKTVADAKSSVPMPVYYGSEDTWIHGTGLVCFDRTINPALYPTKGLTQ